MPLAPMWSGFFGAVRGHAANLFATAFYAPSLFRLTGTRDLASAKRQGMRQER